MCLNGTVGGRGGGFDGSESCIHTPNVHGNSIVRVEIQKSHIVLREGKRNNVHSAIKLRRVICTYIEQISCAAIPRSEGVILLDPGLSKTV